NRADTTLSANRLNYFITGVTCAPCRTPPLLVAETPGPIAGAGLPGLDIGERWLSRLVATAAAACLSKARPARYAIGRPLVGHRRAAPSRHTATVTVPLIP